MAERKQLRPRDALRTALAVTGLAVVRLELDGESDPGEHEHDVLELAFLEHGALVHTLSGRELPGRAGSLLVVPQGQLHRYRVTATGSVLWNLLIDPQRLARPALPATLARLLPELLPAPGGAGLLVDGLDLAGHLAGMLAEQRQRAIGWETGLGGGFALLALAACRGLHAGAGRRLAGGAPQLEALRRRLDEDPRHPWRLPAMAQAAGLSVAHLVRRFRRHTGLTPMAYLRTARMRLAGSLLREGGTLTETAAELGYAHPPALARAFRRALGVPPGRWRRGSGT